ncbi:hypothetical protein RUND412_006945 [Rhizina undulata]
MTSSQIIQTPSAGDNGSRKNDTTIQGYHQIVAVSQNNINASLKFQFRKQKTLREIEFPVNDEGTMKATMNPPTVKLIPNTEQHKVIFYLHFKEGTFEYWTGHGPNSKKQEQRIDNWTLAFTVNLNLLELDQQGVPKEIQDRIKVSDLYSVSQLLLDFQTSDIGKFDYDESSTPNFDLHLAMNEKLYLNMYLDKYLRKLNAGSRNILGYAITVKDPKVFNEEAPGFPPTDLQFQTYEYRPIGYDNISRNDGHRNTTLPHSSAKTAPDEELDTRIISDPGHRAKDVEREMYQGLEYAGEEGKKSRGMGMVRWILGKVGCGRSRA